jgi:signal transduction histidine kinase
MRSPGGTLWRRRTATMSAVGGDRRDGITAWARVARQLAAAAYAPAGTAAVLAVLAAAQAIGLAAAAPRGLAGGGAGNLQLALVLLSLFATLPLAVVRTYPVPAAVVMTAANVLSMAALHDLTAAGATAQILVLYALGRSGIQVLAACLAVPFLLLALPAPDHGASGISRGLAVMLASLGPLSAWAGAARRARRAAAEHSQARAGIEGTLLEHTARGERARISRELHDVVAHHISMIAVQAETARLATPGMPAAGAQRLSAIGDTARAALTEMRRLLGVLREDASDLPAERQPQPGIGQLAELLDGARELSEASTRLIVSGWPQPLDPGTELAAYRIVQEALTNARRHAPGTAVDVELHFGADALWLRIRDNGPGPPPGGPAGGNGLLGMRERATAVGGTLRTGCNASGGFVVQAMLPAKAEREAPR